MNKIGGHKGLTRKFTYKNPTHEELGMMALITCPTPEAACEYLEREHGLYAHPTNLLRTKEYAPQQYEELRQRIVPLKEQALSHNMLDSALYASEVTQVAMEQLKQRLEQGGIPAQYLSRVARDIADVEAKFIEKKMTLENRPTVITETRNAGEIISALERKGIVKQIEVTQGE